MANKNRIFLGLEFKTQQDRITEGVTVGTKMQADANADIQSKGTGLKTAAQAMQNRVTDKKNAEEAAIAATKAADAQELVWDEAYRDATKKTEEIYKDNPPKWSNLGFSKTADVEPTPKEIPDKVTGLSATQGDAMGEGDLIWDPQTGVIGYKIQINSTDPLNAQAWGQATPDTSTSSKETITGLTTGTRYWVRVKAFVTAGDGPPSDPVSFIAP